MSLVSLLVDVGTALEEAGGFLRYSLVFVFAAIPVIEILVVIPIGIGLGFDPIATGAAAFAGNVSSVCALVLCYRRVSRWLARRRGGAAESSERYERARRLWERYGLPGLAFASPVLTGVHVAALVALLAGSRNRGVAGWMTLGILVWTVVLVVASASGVSLLGLA